MRASILHLDDALLPQGVLLEHAAERSVDARGLGPALRLWARPDVFDALRAQLRDTPYDAAHPDIVFCGSGDFHHISFLLISRALEGISAPTTVLHFDNHPDWVTFDKGMHCGSWAARAARLPDVDRVITIGPCSADIDRPRAKGADLRVVEEGRLELYPHRAPHGRASLDICGHRWPSIESLGAAGFEELLLSRIRTQTVYVTIDKDVLAPDDAVTNWDQGETRLPGLLRMLERISTTRRVIGVDIVGDWSVPAYGEGLATRLLKRGESLMDQPWRRPAADHARRINECANLRLLALFAEMA